MKGDTIYPLSQGFSTWNWRRSEDTMKTITGQEDPSSLTVIIQGDRQQPGE